MSPEYKYNSVDEYLESQPAETRRALLELRAIILKTVLAGNKVGKASVQLPNDQPIPEKLIVAIIQY